MNVLSLTASPALSGFTPGPGQQLSAVLPFECAAAERTIKGSQDLTMNRPGLYKELNLALYMSYTMVYSMNETAGSVEEIYRISSTTCSAGLHCAAPE